jgi:nicotinamidase-related amidase
MRPALLLIDLINDIIHPEGRLAECADFVTRHDVIPRTNEAISFFREHSWPVIFVKIAFSDPEVQIPLSSKLFAKAREKFAFVLGTWGTELHEDLLAHPSDPLIVKSRVDAFCWTHLASVLRVSQVDTVVLGGCATSGAIQSTARSAQDRDYRTVILSEACADQNEEIHQQSLWELEFIADVISHAKIEYYFSRAERGTPAFPAGSRQRRMSLPHSILIDDESSLSRSA